MHRFGLSALIALTLLGCTFNTYSSSTLPLPGFGTQAAPASALAYGSGAEVGTVEQRGQPRARVARRLPRAEARKPAARELARNSSAARKPERSGSATREAPRAAAGAANTSKQHGADSSARLAADEGGPEVQADTKPSGSAKPAQGPRSTGGVVVLARGTSATKVRKASATPGKPKPARSSRGIAPTSHDEHESRSRVFAALQAADSKGSSDSGSPDASGTAKLAGRGDSDSRDASATAQLARSERTERTHDDDERASLAGK